METVASLLFYTQVVPKRLYHSAVLSSGQSLEEQGQYLLIEHTSSSYTVSASNGMNEPIDIITEYLGPLTF